MKATVSLHRVEVIEGLKPDDSEKKFATGVAGNRENSGKERATE